MNCTLICNEDMANQQKIGVLPRFITWLQTIKIEGAEQLSKTK